MNPLLEVSHVSKKFKIREDRHRSIKTILGNIITGKWQNSRTINVEILKDVSFDVYPGDFVGLVGRNGVGKSTILKIISGIYRPSQGTVKLHGKVAPVLELGAGFSEDLSGYDNIFLNASILGYGRAATYSRVDEIIKFSELEEYIYTPIRRYSSGMVVRLAFSIAVYLDAPLLLFDEVLAVGDIGFQKKCLDKVHELNSSGKAIVLVTHSPETVEAFCNRCIVLDHSEKIFDGGAKEGAAVYRSLFDNSEN
jgi:ABC-type polysaccharide/polyol phosphate transport system ATPase subunit